MDEQLFAAKISELKKLKKMFRNVATLFNDPLEKENPTLARDAFNEASERVHQRSYKRSRQAIGRPASKRLHSNDVYSDDSIRQSIEDSIRREAEIIYRAKDPDYAKAVDEKDVEFDNLLAEIEQSYYFLHDIFQQYHWVKGTILSGDFGYLRKHARSIRKKWFVGEITEAVDIIDKIQNAMERKSPISLQVEGGELTGSSENTSVINLTKDQVEFLNWVNDKHPEIVFQSHYGKRDPKTVSPIVKTLVKHGFLKRPEGKSKGVVITPLGQKYIEDHFS
jgi:hypothetical protein